MPQPFLYDARKDEILFQKYHDSNPPEQKHPQSNFSKLFYKERALIYQFGQEMFTWITQNSSQYKDPEKVWQARRDYLINTLYKQEPNPEILEILFEEKRKLVEKELTDMANFDLRVDFKSRLKKDTTEYFQGFFSPDKTKFIAILINKGEVSEMNFSFGNGAKNDTVPRPAINKEKWNFEILYGVLYQSNWYVEFSLFESGNNNFDTSVDLESAKKEYLTNLIHRGYFKPHSAELNPDFWEWGEIQTDFSEEIASEKESLKFKNKFESEYLQQKRVNESIKNYQRQAKENAPYKGLLRIVARALQREKSPHFLETFFRNDSIYVPNRIIQSFFYELEEKDTPFPKIIKIMETYKSILPYEKPYCLVPFIAFDKKDKQTLRFLFFYKPTQKIYEWTYFQPFPLEKKYEKRGEGYFEHKEYMEELIDKKLLQLTNNLEDDTISDDKFWQEYVFKQKKDKYEFLRYVADFSKK